MIGIDNELRYSVSGELRTLIRDAAALRGQSVSNFVISTLEETSIRVVQEQGTTVLSDRDRDIFLAMLDTDPEPNETLKQAARRFRGRDG